MAQKIRLKLFTVLETNLQETQINRESFQEVLTFASLSQKMVLYWLSKFCIFKPFTKIQSHRRFDLGFWQTSGQVYKNLQHGEIIFAKFQSQPRFPRKLVSYSLSKFVIIKTGSNILWLRRFDFHFLQASQQVYRKPQHKEKVFGEFQGLPRFPRKMILYSLTKFGIIKTGTNIPWLRIFDLRFLQTSKLVFRKLQYTESLWKVSTFALLFQKNGLVFVKQIMHL